MSRVALRGLCALLIGSSAAWDLVVRNGEVLVLDNRAVAFGSSSSTPREVPPRPAVEIQPGGFASVMDADVFGGSALPSATDRIGSIGASGVAVRQGGLQVVQG